MFFRVVTAIRGPVLAAAATLAVLFSGSLAAQEPVGEPVVPWRTPQAAEPAAAFESRQGPAMAALLAKSGGSLQTQQAVDAALDWIARHQNPDGSWFLDYHQRCRGPGCTGPGSFNAPGAATGLALLPFLARGHTHQAQGPFRQVVYNGLTWLLVHQQPTGDLSVTGGQTQMYSHAIATIALGEAYGMTHDLRLQLPAVAALRFIVAGQDKQSGGWWYTYRMAGGDTSVFGWQLTALETARKAGLDPGRSTFELARKWLEGVSHGNSKGLFSYRPDQQPSISMTAVGLLDTQYLALAATTCESPKGRGSSWPIYPTWHTATTTTGTTRPRRCTTWLANSGINGTRRCARCCSRPNRTVPVAPPAVGTPSSRWPTPGPPRADA